ncbi:hypothetical protein OQ477_12090 [Bacillus sp. ChL18]|uniref:YxiG family protein n=1 Tax=Bacillus TaxID=1386 RepID=UPI00066FCD2B|nr:MULTISPECIES: hypothetical protein [unclassified Bacillus (in: firmicutes)]MCX2810712.1 hypothetical protein [Bacillus sp. ChL18]
MNNPLQKLLIDSECIVLKTDFHFFKKEFILHLEVNTKGKKQQHCIEFKNVSSLFFYAGKESSLDGVNAEKRWRLHSFSCYPQGIGTIYHPLIEDYESNANILIGINEAVYAIETERVIFDSTEIYASDKD